MQSHKHSAVPSAPPALIGNPSREPMPQFLRLPAVIHLTGLGRSTIYRMVAAKEFPCPVKLATRAVAWRRADVDRWSESRQPSTAA
jgi:prophage regulatory protein